MERCTEHDLLNCKCREPLATFLVRQFRESPHVRVVRYTGDGGGDRWRGGDRSVDWDHRERLGRVDGGQG